MQVQTFTTWQVVQVFAQGSYIEGDVFVNAQGQQLTFDGDRINGIEAAPLNSEWVHAEDFADWQKELAEEEVA